MSVIPKYRRQTTKSQNSLAQELDVLPEFGAECRAIVSSPAASYRGYSDLAGQQVEGTDYQVHVRANAQSSVAVIAPHGGGIERYTSEIARAIAGDDFNLYLISPEAQPT
ncbi:MAG: poly-gamma-glutamate hydrolase family protein [Rhodocyclaceae bacterium]|nr:poly-gamma-glutamate hydrolase family protein [Rhodocyclaceae bacterium]MBK7814389.1 poly-gamma-glutamate hydrolase family protein [Rhodocyclaceae bacterium]